MSEYQSKTDIPKLIGSFETGNPGLLSSAIRENPYTVLLLDEIEKADRDLINIFLTVLDEGYFTDGAGKRVDCKNLVVIATSNAGSDFLYASAGSMQNKNISDYLVENHIFTPEFLNRFDGVITFNPLNQEAVVAIAKKMLAKISDDIYGLHKIRVNISDVFLTELAKKSYDPKFGARNMERLINEEIEDKIAKMLLDNKVGEGDTINL